MHILPHLVKGAFTPTLDMITSAKILLEASAHEQVVRQIVTAYKVKILAHMRPKVSRRWTSLGEPDRVILNPDLDYLLSCKSFKVYLQHRTKEGRRAGYVFKPGTCPLLLAESACRDAQTQLVQAMESLSGLSKDNLLCRPNGLEAYYQYIEDSLYLLKPYVLSEAMSH